MKTSGNDRKPSSGKSPIPTANTLFAKQNGGKPIRCVYCKELHYSAFSEKVQHPEQQPNSAERTKMLEQSESGSYVINSCRNPKVCRLCIQRHHQSICPTLSSSGRGEKQSSPPEVNTSNTTTTNTVRNKGTS